MGNTKFEECYLRSRDEILSVEKLQEIHGKHDGEYDDKYYGDFYCPECFAAQLSFHPNAQTPHFKTKPSAKHEEDCSYNFKSAKKKELEDYCYNSDNHDSINRKLKTCLELLNKSPKKQKSIQTRGEAANNSKYNYFTFGEGEARRSIRRKKLSMPLHEDHDYNIPMIFYGIVFAEWDLRNDNMKYIRLRNAKTDKYICAITVSKNIYFYIDDSMKFDNKRKCDIAFITSMVRKEKFNNCAISYSTELIISNISTQSIL
ncbi:hypothetical protein [Anaerovorax sp. IOR16]|uniref:hypothetical protein n=1 Tax=Anaerovorax sp. IOR16 TaxID=2773458 RepID=UPI0019CFCC8F|nr:hypothetical protein [Anaerovorax sp. IOR16]